MTDHPARPDSPIWVHAPVRLVELLGDAGIGVWEFDHATGVFVGSPHVHALYGFRDPLTGPETLATFMACVHPDDVARVQAASAHAFAHGETLVHDYRIRRADTGEERWLRTRSRPVRTDRGTRGREVGVLVDVTEERRRADQLEEGRRLLADAQRIAGIGSFTWDVATNEVSWSEETFRILGLDPAGGHPGIAQFLALLGREDQERFHQALNDALAGRRPFDIEVTVARPDGTRVRLHDRGEFERDADGRPVRMTGTKQDVTALREADWQIRQQARELARAQRMARLGSWSWDLRTGSVWWSPQVWTIFELDAGVRPSVEALRGLFPPGQQAAYDRAVEGALHHDVPYEVEVSTTLPSGRTLTVRALGEVERDPMGQPVAMHGAVQDVTEERARERAVQESEQVFRTLATAGPSGVFRTTADGRVSYANPRLLELWELTQDEFAAGWRRRVHPDDLARVEAASREAVEGPGTFRSEYRILTSRGVRHVRVNTSPVRDDDGHYAGQIGVVTDMTEDVAAREAAARFEEEVRHAQKLESLGVMAGGIAHDFNNLLVGVLTNAGLALKEVPEGSPAHELVANVQLAAQRAAELTRQLLAYSGRGRLHVGPVDVNELAREMTSLLKTALSKRARLVLDLGRDLPAIEGDATQLRQLIMNLLTNASDALGERDGVVVLRTRTGPVADAPPPDITFGTVTGEPAVILEVEDDGAGMDEATMRRIFDPFFTTKFTGRGLGLSAAQGIVRSHRGAITLRSAPGRGTVFAVHFPVGLRPAAPPPAPAPRRATVAPGERRLLVVDDDDGVRGVLMRLLRSQGFEVEGAANGERAVAMVGAEPGRYHAVLLDLTMPVMGGREAFCAIRAIAPDLPVVMMSGYSEDEMGAVDGNAPAAVLQKPFTPTDVLAVLDRLPAPPVGVRE